MTLAAVKQALRKEAAHAVQGLSRSALEEQLQALPQFRAARTISIYLSMPSGELDTWALCRAALDDKALYVPRFSTLAAGSSANAKHKFTTDMEMLRVHDAHELAHGLTQNKTARQVRTLSNEALADASLDVIIVPGMLFDRRGGRLGHGKGYYDRYLQKAAAHATARGRPVPYIGTLLFAHPVAVALREQVRDAPVPMDDTDVSIDALITADETRIFSP